MGGPVELVEAPNGAIANKRILDGIEKVAWLEPTIEQPVEGVWVFGGYGLAPISIIDTDEGLIAFDTGDTKHDGELLLEAVRTVSDKPIKAIIYGHSHIVFGAEVLAEGNEDIQVIGHPNLNAVVEANMKAAGAPAYFQELGPYLTARMLIQFNAFMRAGRAARWRPDPPRPVPGSRPQVLGKRTEHVEQQLARRLGVVHSFGEPTRVKLNRSTLRRNNRQRP